MMIHNLGLKFIDLSNNRKNNTAIIIKNKKFSFKVLDNDSNRVCKWLISKGFKNNDIICISSKKTFFNYVLIVSLLKLGITYVVLDRKSPKKRLDEIINQIKPSAVILEEKKDIEKINFKKIIFKKQINLKKNEKKLINIYDEVKKIPSSTIAYLMFTSGSTGIPKGVAISHSKLLYFSEWCKMNFGISFSDRVTNVNPLFFDNSVFDIFGGLFNGACILPLSRLETINPVKVINYLKLNKASIWFSVPSLIIYFQKFNNFKQETIPFLKKIIFGGEGFPKKNLMKLYFSFKKANLYNVYGPTECTCICSSYKISKFDFTRREISRLAPLGSSLARNFKYLILDDNLNKVKPGQIGELFIGGDNVGGGYYNQLRETKEKFIQNPLHQKYIDIYYKSGDLVYIDKTNKLIYFSSRKDNQIKLNGYRIELDDIENNINLIKGVKECAVTYGKKNNNYEITAWVDSKVSLNFIYSSLSNRLPNYMIPNNIFIVTHIPKNSNGKIDRNKLKKRYYD